MWIPQVVTFKRFISHPESTFEFLQGKATMIYGANRDDEDQESNGSGKSVIEEAVMFCMTGAPLRDVRSAELIMDGAESAEVEMVLKNARSKQELKIRRVLDQKKSAQLSVWLNNKPKQFATVNDGNKLVLDLLGVSREDLCNYFIVSKESYESFFGISDTKKKAVIARFSGADMVDPVDPLIKEDVRVSSEAVNNLLSLKDGLFGKIEAYEEQLASFDIKGLERQRDSEIQVITERILKGESLIDTYDKNVIGLVKDLTKFKDELSAVITEDFTNALDGISQKREKTAQLKKEDRSSWDEFETFQSELNRVIQGSAECPKCLHVFSLTDGEISIDEAKNNLPKVAKEIESINKLILIHTETITQLDESEREIQKKISESHRIKFEIEARVRQCELGIEHEKKNKVRDEAGILRLKEEIKQLRDQEIKDERGHCKVKIKQCRDNIKSIEAEIEAEGNKKFAAEEWLFNFKRFKTHLSNKAIGSIEAFTNEYLKKTGSNLSVHIDGYKMLSSGTIKESISSSVLRNGIDAGVFGRFSSGERVKVEICLILALQKLINMNSGSGGIDLLFLDEIIESVDSAGVEGIMGALNGLGQTVDVITHTTHTKQFENVVTVVKENGHSTISR